MVLTSLGWINSTEKGHIRQDFQGKVAACVVDAMSKDQFYILTHPDYLEAVQLRTDKLLKLENPQSPMAIVMKMMRPANS